MSSWSQTHILIIVHDFNNSEMHPFNRWHFAFTVLSPSLPQFLYGYSCSLLPGLDHLPPFSANGEPPAGVQASSPPETLC